MLGGGSTYGKIGATLGAGWSISEPGADAAGAGADTVAVAATVLCFLAAAEDGGVAAKAIAPTTPRMSENFTTDLLMIESPRFLLST
jgi:hypothetical protein